MYVFFHFALRVYLVEFLFINLGYCMWLYYFTLFDNAVNYSKFNYLRSVRFLLILGLTKDNIVNYLEFSKVFHVNKHPIKYSKILN